MNKLKALLPVLLILLLLLAVVPATAEEAENLTGGLTVKTVDKPGKISCITGLNTASRMWIWRPASSWRSRMCLSSS